MHWEADTSLIAAEREIAPIIQKHNPEAERERRLSRPVLNALRETVPRANCEVIDTWDVMGMRGTGSHDISVTDVYVPKSRTFPMVPAFEPGSHYQGPLYRLPLVGAASPPPRNCARRGRRRADLRTSAR
jgi:alkylation response protein AidB-like acyl-CoA dehydrogenase